MAKIDYESARQMLAENFAEVETAHINGSEPLADRDVIAAYDRLFRSRTQAYREVLLGCIVAKLQEPAIDVRLPYISQGTHAYSGRSLDEKVINPFLRGKRIPCSKGPFLSVFRRSVKFDRRTRAGLRDVEAFDAFLSILEKIVGFTHHNLLAILRYHLWRFIQLREQSHIEISKLRRISLEQCDALISELLDIPSGGRFPVFLVVATFVALQKTFELDWVIDFQGINVADEASGAGGDVTVSQGGSILLSAEVTERMVDNSRLVSTFDTKIAPNAIEDYLFFIRDMDQASAAVEQARQYFSQGHDVNFLEIKNWIVNILGLAGRKGREVFINEMSSRLDNIEIPASLKVAWNNLIVRLASGHF